MIYLFISLILLLTFFLRAYPRIILPNAIASDTYFHLYLTKKIIANKLKYPKKDDRFLLNSECNYPFFYHWLLALFGEKKLYVSERHSSAIFDTINNLIVFFFSISVFHNNQLNEFYCLIPSLIYCFHPALIKSGDEPRVHNGSSRVLAQTLYLVHIYGLYLFISTNSMYALTFSIFAAAFIFFTTVFGIQVILFFQLILVFVIPYYPLVVLASFLLSLLITWGRSWSILKINFQHSAFLFKSKLYYQKLSLRTDLKIYIKAVLSFLNYLASLKILKLVHNFYFSTSHLHRLLFSFNTFLIIFYWSYFEKYTFLYIWILASIVLFLLTKIPILRFAGKAERYLEFGIVPSFILISVCISENPKLIFMLIPFTLFGLIGVYKYNKEFIDNYTKENSEFVETKEIFEAFNAKNKAGIIWTLHPFLYRLMFYSKFPILGYFAGTINKKKSSEAELADIMGNYPYPSYDLFTVTNKYKVDYIITKKQYLNQYLETAKINYGELLTHFEVVEENASLIFLKKR